MMQEKQTHIKEKFKLCAFVFYKLSMYMYVHYKILISHQFMWK